MNARISQAFSAAAAGALIGTAAFVRWTFVAASEPGASHGATALLNRSSVVLAVALGGLGTAVLLLLGRAWRPSREAKITALLATVGGLAVYATPEAVLGSARVVWPQAAVLPVVAGLALAISAHVAKRRHLLPCALMIALGSIPSYHGLRSVAGDRLALAAVQYAPVPPVSYLVGLALSLAYLGALVGLLAGWLLGARPWRGTVLGILGGLAVAAAVASAQYAAFFTAMGSGQTALSIWAALVAVWGSVSLSCALAARAWCPGRSLMLRWAPVAALIAVAAYCAIAGGGHSAYLGLKNCHGDSQFVYLHFSSGGAWCRTFDESGSAARLRRCQQFLWTYPRSAYRPAVLLMLAESQYALWDFEPAAATLRRVARQYPDLRGYPDVLNSISQYAAGRPYEVLRYAQDGEFFARWRGTQGALLAGTAAERLGQAHRALGFYNSYIEHLHTQAGSSWSPGSARFAGEKADYLVEHLDTSGAVLPRGLVLMRLVNGTQPLAGARIALVQPHRDAAFPTDSKQFTGAWSIAAWSGLCGVSDRDGVVRLRNVPYGTYDVVVGLDLKLARAGLVLAPALPPVNIERRVTRLRPIALVSAIKQLLPAPGAAVSENVKLAWERYPGANDYAVSVVVVEEPGISRGSRAGRTCWARSGISARSAPIDAKHFVDGHSSLRKGGSYMWIVYAYGSDGRLLSSSEHYSQLHEPVFTVE